MIPIVRGRRYVDIVRLQHLRLSAEVPQKTEITPLPSARFNRHWHWQNLQNITEEIPVPCIIAHPKEVREIAHRYREKSLPRTLICCTPLFPLREIPVFMCPKPFKLGLRFPAGVMVESRICGKEPIDVATERLVECIPEPGFGTTELIHQYLPPPPGTS